MRRIGLTGSLAAGKSTVGRLFEAWGACRIDADELAREAVGIGTTGLAAVRALLGNDVLDAQGGLDRGRVRERVFHDPEVREGLEGIIHAEVRRLRDERVGAARAAGCDTTVEEIPLLFEAGLEEAYDAVVVVDAPLRLRRARAVAARGWSAAEFDRIEAAQMPPAEKRARSLYVIDNEGTREELEQAARSVWQAVSGAPA